MTKFKDAAGHEWELSLSVGSLNALKGVGYDFASLEVGQRWAEALYCDPLAMARALWILCRVQVGAKNITEDAFMDGLDGAAIEAGGEALIGGMVNFFHRRQSSAINLAMPDLITKFQGHVNAATTKSLEKAFNS